MKRYSHFLGALAWSHGFTPAYCLGIPNFYLSPDLLLELQVDVANCLLDTSYWISNWHFELYT